MDSRVLLTLIAVVETGAISAAARRLKLTPAAVSQRIATLERDLGCALFHRGAHHLVPTNRCLEMVPAAREVIALTDRIAATARDDGLRGELRVGAIASAMTGLLPDTVRRLSGDAPGLRLRLTPGSSAQIYEDLLSGAADLGLLVAPPFPLPKSLRADVLRRERLICLSPRPITPCDIATRLRTEPFIRYDPGSWGGAVVAAFLRAQGLQPEVLCDLDALDTILVMVRAGLGNALLPEWAAIDLTGCHWAPVDTPDAPTRHILLAHPTHSAKSPAIARFRACLQPAAAAAAAAR